MQLFGDQKFSPYSFAMILWFACYEYNYSLIDTLVMAQGFRQGKDPAVLGTAQLLQKQSQLKLTHKFSETVEWLTMLLSSNQGIKS